MKITITNDEGEVYAILTDVHLDTRIGRYVGTDDEGEVTLISGALFDASIWSKANERKVWTREPVQDGSQWRVPGSDKGFTTYADAVKDDGWCPRCEAYGNVHDPEKHGLERSKS